MMQLSKKKYICYRKDWHLMSSATTIAAKMKQLKHWRLCDVPFSPCHISIVTTLNLPFCPNTSSLASTHPTSPHHCSHFHYFHIN